MSYFRHLEACNRFDPDRFLPLCLDGRRVGFVRRDRAAALADEPRVFTVGDRAIDIVPTGSAAVTEALAGAVERLIRRGLLPGSRREPFSVAARWGGPALFELDRGAVPFFGTRSYGVHLNGWRRQGDDVELWIGRRAPDKKIAPNKLDNLVAGGISAGYGARATLVKEGAEEAAMPAELVARARATSAIMYRMELPEGMRDDVLFVYDIEAPADYVPRNTDGEISDFRIMPFTAVMGLVALTEEFKFNVNLVLIDFAIRHGFLTPEEPEYVPLLAGLRGGLIRGPR